VEKVTEKEGARSHLTASEGLIPQGTMARRGSKDGPLFSRIRIASHKQSSKRDNDDRDHDPLSEDGSDPRRASFARHAAGHARDASRFGAKDGDGIDPAQNADGGRGETESRRAHSPSLALVPHRQASAVRSPPSSSPSSHPLSPTDVSPWGSCPSSPDMPLSVDHVPHVGAAASSVVSAIVLTLGRRTRRHHYRPDRNDATTMTLAQSTQPRCDTPPISPTPVRARGPLLDGTHCPNGDDARAWQTSPSQLVITRPAPRATCGHAVPPDDACVSPVFSRTRNATDAVRNLCPRDARRRRVPLWAQCIKIVVCRMGEPTDVTSVMVDPFTLTLDTLVGAARAIAAWPNVPATCSSLFASNADLPHADGTVPRQKHANRALRLLARLTHKADSTNTSDDEGSDRAHGGHGRGRRTWYAHQARSDGDDASNELLRSIGGRWPLRRGRGNEDTESAHGRLFKSDTDAPCTGAREGPVDDGSIRCRRILFTHNSDSLLVVPSQRDTDGSDDNDDNTDGRHESGSDSPRWLASSLSSSTTSSSQEDENDTSDDANGAPCARERYHRGRHRDADTLVIRYQRSNSDEEDGLRIDSHRMLHKAQRHWAERALRLLPQTPTRPTLHACNAPGITCMRFKVTMGGRP